MNDGQSKTVEPVNGRTDKLIGVRTTILVYGEGTLRVLNYFYHNKGTWSIAQVSRILTMPYEATKSALRRLSRNSLVMKVQRGYAMADSRRPVAANVLRNPGERVSVETGEPVRLSVQLNERPLEQVSREVGPVGPIEKKDEPVEKIDSGGLKTSDPSESTEIIVGFKPWTEIVDWRSGWPENKTLPTIRLPGFIIQQIRSMSNEAPKTNAGWLWFYGSEYTMRVASKQALQIYLGAFTWKDELKEWLLTIPNLTQEDLDLIWNKIAEAAKHVNVTYEFHVPDANLASVRPYLFREGGPQRRKTANVPGICIFSPSATGTRGGGEGAIGIRGESVYQSSSTIRHSRALREKIPRSTGGCNGRCRTDIHSAIRRSPQNYKGGDRAGQSGIRPEIQAITGTAAIATGGI